MSLKLTDSGSPVVKPSTCFENLLLSLKIHSVVRFSDNVLKTNFE